MKPVETWIYAILLLVALGLSWRAWKGEEPEAKQSVAVFDPGAGGIEEIRWEGKRDVATIAFSGRGDELSAWVTAGKRKRLPGPAPVPAPAEPATPAVEATPADPHAPKETDLDKDKKEKDAEEEEDGALYGEPELKSFPGNSQAKDLYQGMSPLQALREFQGLDAATVAEMGLDKPEATLVVKAGGKELKLTIGDKAYGSSDSYARVDGQDSVYLISNKVLGPLRAAESRLLERDILGFEPTEAAQATISDAAGGTALALHQGRHDKENAFWADPAAPDAASAVLDGLMKKALGLRASAYLKAEEMPAPGSVESLARVSFAGDAGDLGWIELGRVPDPVKSKPDDPVWDWYARSQRTREQWARVPKSSGQELLDALTGAMGK